jgi:hypothetical protein
MAQDIVTAHALLSIRSILLRIPQRETELIPFQWTRRFGKHLGSYADFIRQRTPNIFSYDETDEPGLILVRMTDDFITVGYLQHQRVAAGEPLPAICWDEFHDDDKQYYSLVKISNIQTRGRIAGGAEVLKRAFNIIERLCTTDVGITSERCVKALGEAGIPPLPFEWFKDVVVPGTSTVYLRTSSRPQLAIDTTDRVAAIIEYELSHSLTKSVSVEHLSQVLNVDATAVTQWARKYPFALHEPDKIYSCSAFERIVQGYISPETKSKIQMLEEISSMTPLRHLIRSIETAIRFSPNNRIPTEYAIAWCSSLDVKPKLVWQCLRDTVVWSSLYSDSQVFLRTNQGKAVHQGTGSPEELPKDVITQIKQEVEKLGAHCTLDKLSAALTWGKSSENRRKYGLLKNVLQNIPDIFFEPRFMFLRSGIEHLIVIPKDTEPGSAKECLERADNEYRNLAQINATVVYYLTQAGFPAYPANDLLNAFSQYSIPHDYLPRLRHLFAPGDFVYLRKDISSVYIPPGSIQATILYALRASSRKALDLDSLLKVMRRCGRFPGEAIDAILEEIVMQARDITSAIGDSVARICYYNPDVIILDETASRYLELPVHEVKKPSVIDLASKQDDE